MKGIMGKLDWQQQGTGGMSSRDGGPRRLSFLAIAPEMLRQAKGGRFGLVPLSAIPAD